MFNGFLSTISTGPFPIATLVITRGYISGVKAPSDQSTDIRVCLESSKQHILGSPWMRLMHRQIQLKEMEHETNRYNMFIHILCHLSFIHFISESQIGPLKKLLWKVHPKPFFPNIHGSVSLKGVKITWQITREPTTTPIHTSKKPSGGLQQNLKRAVNTPGLPHPTH